MLFTKAAGGGNGANKVVGSGKEDGGGGGGIVIYSGDDDGGVGECDDEDLRRLESMGAKNKATEGEKEPADAIADALDTKGRIHIGIRLFLMTKSIKTNSYEYYF